MKLSHPSLSAAKAVTDCLFHQSAGVEISGDPGSGKTNAMKVMQQEIIRRCPDQGLLSITPEAQDAREMYHFCLDQGASVAARTIYFHPADTRMTLSFNPLSIPGDPCDDITLRARRTNKINHVSNILLPSTGYTDGFNMKPLLRRWLQRILITTAAAGLPLPEAYHFVDTQSDIYEELIRAAPDTISRNEFAELPRMRPADREAIISSAKNQILTINENPVTEAVLGRVDCFLKARELIRQGYIVIANLERGGVLREIDQEFLANFLLTEFLHDIFNMPEDELMPYFVFVDELPVFRSSAQLISYALARIRKYKLRFIGAHQGTTLFPGRTEDPLLHAMVSMCGVHLYFNHCNPVDAKFFGEVVGLPSYSPTKVKHVLKQTQQYQDGNDLVTLTDSSQSDSEGEDTGGSETDGLTKSDSWNDETTSTRTTTDNSQRSTSNNRGRTRDEDTLRETVQEARADVVANGSSNATGNGHAQGRGGSTANSRTSGRTWSRSRNRTTGVTFKQSLVPRLKWREIVASIQFLTPEEQMMMAATQITRHDTGEATLHISRQGVFQVQFPMACFAFARTPKFASKKETEHFRLLSKRPEYAPPQTILSQRSKLLQVLLAKLRKLPAAEDRQPAELEPAVLEMPQSAKRGRPAKKAICSMDSSPLAI